VSLDEQDSDPVRFLAYVIAAIQTVAPDLAQAAQLALQSPLAPVDLVLTTLVNELMAWPDVMLVVLDDYQRVDSSAVDTAVGFLLDHLPSHVHLVIVTREDPRLQLSRLRASGQMTEVRVVDLRFTVPE